MASLESRLAELAAEYRQSRELLTQIEKDRKADHDVLVSLNEQVKTACATIIRLQEAREKGHDSFGSKVWQVIGFGFNAVTAAIVAIVVSVIRTPEQ